MTLIIRTTGFSDYLEKAGGAYVKALIMGLPDAGKTRSASFWPNPIFADCEKGRMSIADRGVPYAEITSSADMEALLDMLRRECLKPPTERKYQTLVIDTLDSYQRIVIQERLRAERREMLSGWADWGYIDAKMSAFVERMLALPMNIVVNLHVKDGQDDEILVKLPKLKGDIKDQISAEFDLVGIMETGYEAIDGERVKVRQIRWHSEPRYPLLKDRSGRLPRFTEVDFTPGDYDRIFQSIISPAMDDMPESTEVERLETGDADAAPPDVKGGPLEAAPPPRKGTRKAPVRKAKASDEATPVAVQYVDTETGEILHPDSAMQTAVGVAVDGLGATVVSVDEAVTETPVPADAGKEKTYPRCGEQPQSMIGKADPVAGCGKSLQGEDRDRVNIAVLRAKTMLCADCFAKFKASH